MNEPVPIIRSLEGLYPAGAIGTEQQRWNDLKTRFSEIYDGNAPEFVARSPGRVNILGEHIDYSLYEVLPMAVASDVIIAVSTSEESPARVSITNFDHERFKSNKFDLKEDGDIEIDNSTLEWTNYFKAGLRGATDLLRTKNPNFKHRSMQVLLSGTVPAGGGLSSSAAFVCASALAVLRAHRLPHIEKKDIVELAIISERACGVNSGGMDQAASVFSIRGYALSVSFSPNLRAEAIAFPPLNPPITFMIAQSFVSANKHDTAPRCYNLRVVECTLAAEYLALKLHLKLETDSSPLGKSLRGLQNAFFHSSSSNLSPEAQLQKLRSLTSDFLSPTGYTREEIATELSIPVHELESRYMTLFPVHTTHFQLRPRALHVFSEALRVLAFKSLLQNPPHDNETLLTNLGNLMNETQTSCRDLYDCSCPEIDSLCEIARRAGSYGSRLTGAGWGGCTVHLVPKGKVETVRRAWVEEYYRRKWPEMGDEELEKAVVVSEPSGGSFV